MYERTLRLIGRELEQKGLHGFAIIEVREGFVVRGHEEKEQVSVLEFQNDMLLKKDVENRDLRSTSIAQSSQVTSSLFKNLLGRLQRRGEQ